MKNMKTATNDNGFIKTYRSLLSWEWHDNAYVLSVFMHCLLLANWQDKKWHGKVIRRGSLITSFQRLADTCGIAINTCRNACEKLQETGELTIETTNKYTLITVNNYDRYQVENGFDNHLDNHVDNHLDMHLDVQEMNNKMENNMYTTEEYKKYKKEEYIVRFLNKNAKKHYKCTKRTIYMIQYLFQEGFTTEDICKVITNKCADWIGTEYEKYLRPATLFGENFESYLNQNQNNLPTWYTSEPVRNTEPVPATQEEIEKVKELMMKGVNHENHY